MDFVQEPKKQKASEENRVRFAFLLCFLSLLDCLRCIKVLNKQTCPQHRYERPQTTTTTRTKLKEIKQSQIQVSAKFGKRWIQRVLVHAILTNTA